MDISFNSKDYHLILDDCEYNVLRISSKSGFKKSARYILDELANFWSAQEIKSLDNQKLSKFLQKADDKKWSDLTKKFFICMNEIAKNTCDEFIEVKYKYESLSFHYNRI